MGRAWWSRILRHITCTYLIELQFLNMSKTSDPYIVAEANSNSNYNYKCQSIFQHHLNISAAFLVINMPIQQVMTYHQSYYLSHHEIPPNSLPGLLSHKQCIIKSIKPLQVDTVLKLAPAFHLSTKQ